GGTREEDSSLAVGVHVAAGRVAGRAAAAAAGEIHPAREDEILRRRAIGATGEVDEHEPAVLRGDVDLKRAVRLGNRNGAAERDAAVHGFGDEEIPAAAVGPEHEDVAVRVRLDVAADARAGR